MNKRTFACLVLKSTALLIALLCFYPLSATNPQKKEMKELNVKKVSLANVAVENIPALLDKEKVAFQSINTVNWKAFPYQPEVQFRIAHTDDAILVHYKVKEASVRAVAAGDNGAVWEDACVEFFSIPAGDGIYFKHQITNLDGKTVRANFYKCGDKLQTPHFLSWNPIGLEKPNFHCPEFFGTLSFE